MGFMMRGVQVLIFSSRAFRLFLFLASIRIGYCRKKNSRLQLFPSVISPLMDTKRAFVLDIRIQKATIHAKTA